MTKHLLFLLLFLLVPSLTASAQTLNGEVNSASTHNALKVSDQKIIHVHFKTIYLDGFKTEKVSKVKGNILELKTKFKTWQFVKQTHSDIYFQKNINDISPVSKATGIFGINNQHTLTIFNGSPKNDQIIQTFFQIDTDALEAHLQTKLKEGIPVKSKKNFQSVMNVLIKYQKQKS